MKTGLMHQLLTNSTSAQSCLDVPGHGSVTALPQLKERWQPLIIEAMSETGVGRSMRNFFEAYVANRTVTYSDPSWGTATLECA